MLAACKEPAEAPPPPRPASSIFSPEAASRLPLADVGDGGALAPREPMPGVLGEIVAATPSAARTSTGPDGGTLVGTETGVAAEDPGASGTNDGGVDASASKGTRGPTIAEGKPEVHAGIPSHAVERAARAQLYHPLVKRCRDVDGKILPPDAIELRFNIDVDGTIVPTSISALAVDARHQAAANCMLRELSATPFRAPAASRGVVTTVTATVPSVD